MGDEGGFAPAVADPEEAHSANCIKLWLVVGGLVVGGGELLLLKVWLLWVLLLHLLA